MAHMKKKKRCYKIYHIENYLLARANLIWHRVRWLGSARR